MGRLLAVCAFLAAGSTAIATDDPSKAAIDGIAVDEAGAPVVGATIRVRQWLHPDATAVSAADGRFHIVLDDALANYCPYAATADGTRQGRQCTEFMDFSRIVAIRVVLKPAATVRVTVVDAGGAAVPGAVVAMDDQAGMLAHSITDATGAATMRVPADAKVNVVVGFKGGVGFDYFENFHASEEDRLPVPAAVRLVLDGARTIRTCRDRFRWPAVGRHPVLPRPRGQKGQDRLYRKYRLLVCLGRFGCIASFRCRRRRSMRLVSPRTQAGQSIRPHRPRLPLSRVAVFRPIHYHGRAGPATADRQGRRPSRRSGWRPRAGSPHPGRGPRLHQPLLSRLCPQRCRRHVHAGTLSGSGVRCFRPRPGPDRAEYHGHGHPRRPATDRPRFPSGSRNAGGGPSDCRSQGRAGCRGNSLSQGHRSAAAGGVGQGGQGHAAGADPLGEG